MNTRKTTIAILSAVVVVVMAFCTYWTVDNWKALSSFFTGTKVTTNKELAAEREQYNKLIAEYSAKIKELGGNVSDFELRVSELLENDIANSTVIESLRSQISTMQINAASLSSQISEHIALNTNLAADNQSLNLLLTQMQGQLLGYVSTLGKLHDLVVYLSNILTEWNNRPEYLVTFYVDGAIWDIQVIDYNNSSVVIPTAPQGYFIFSGWSLDGETVIDITQIVIISDTEFYAVIIQFQSYSFENDTVETIVSMCQAGYAPIVYPVGSEKRITMAKGTADEQNITLVVIGHNHDDLADGSGKAPMSIGVKELLKTSQSMNSTNTNAGGWQASALRNNILPIIIAQLPSDWQTAIKTVTKYTANNGNQSGAKIVPTEDKIWLFSQSEITASTTSVLLGEGSIYEYWETHDTDLDRMKTGNATSTYSKYWWTRSPSSVDATGFRRVTPEGSIIYSNASFAVGICFGFCI